MNNFKNTTIDMSLDPAVLDVIGDIICGDDREKYPKYRSSYLLTSFFQSINIDVTHDGSSRKRWVLSVLEKLSPVDLEKVIKRLVDPKEYKGELKLIKSALEEVNRALRMDGYGIRYNKQVPVVILLSTGERRVIDKPSNVVESSQSTDKHTYYSQRQGGDNARGYNYSGLKTILKNDLKNLVKEGYFNEYLGMNRQEGRIKDLSIALIRETGKDNLEPFMMDLHFNKTDDLFDVIEFLYRNVSKPDQSTRKVVESNFFESEGFTFDTFDQHAGQKRFNMIINEAFSGWQENYELTNDGHVEIKLSGEQQDVIKKWEGDSNDSITRKVKKAIKDYKRSRDDLDARQDSVRTLADALEELQKSGNLNLSRKDESDLFNIANNFGIRHANTKQKTDYDRDIWLEWIFFYYITTINAVIRMIDKQKNK